MFSIQIRFLGGLSITQQAVFDEAAARWSEVITGNLPRFRVEGEIIDGIVIEAQGTRIDGPGRILGQAGPTFLRPNTFLPIKGMMEFDVGDLAKLEFEGSLASVILHEMGHVLGLGTIWRELRLIRGSGTANPVLIGANSMREFSTLIGVTEASPVPIENTGGAGTREGHWRESVFGNELMTGFLSGSSQPFSRLTIAAFQDLGYQVDYSVANSFILPTTLQLAMMGIGADPHCTMNCSMCGCRMHKTQPVTLPENALVD
jgi:Leishmanolysin